MRRQALLPWCLLAVSSTLVAAGPGPALRKPPRADAGTQKVVAAPPPKPQPAAPRRPVTAATKPAPSKPVTTTKPAPAPKPATRPAFQVAELTAPAKTAPAPRTAAARGRPTDPAALRRFLAEWQPRVAATEQDLAALRARLVEGGAEISRILEDRSLSALSSEENRQFGAIPAAAALRAHGSRDWLRQLSVPADRPAPARVEEVVRQVERVAAVAPPELQAAAGSSLLYAHLTAIPGPLHESPLKRPYAVKGVDALKSQTEKRKAALDAQYRAVREEWIEGNAQGLELARRYAQLKTNLLAPDGF